MPVHGLKADIELGVLVVSAGILSYFLTDQLVSNILFTVLLGALFYIEGLHVDTGFLNDYRRKKMHYGLGLIAVYAVTPAIAYILGLLIPDFRFVLMVLGISAAALGSPRVWSNLSKADGDLAGKISSLSLFTAPIFVPLLLFILPLRVDISMISNAVIAFVPFIVGVGIQNYRNEWVSDARDHFSKLAFWLIVLITFIQFQFLYQTGGNFFLVTAVEAAFVLSIFVLASFSASYAMSRAFEHYEKEARAVGFIGGSKNIAVAFLVASMVGAETVGLVGLYYFVRQFIGVGLADFFRHGEFKSLKSIVLKDS